MRLKSVWSIVRKTNKMLYAQVHSVSMTCTIRLSRHDEVFH